VNVQLQVVLLMLNVLKQIALQQELKLTVRPLTTGHLKNQLQA